jgi:hypothetical protein
MQCHPGNVLRDYPGLSSTTIGESKFQGIELRSAVSGIWIPDQLTGSGMTTPGIYCQTLVQSLRACEGSLPRTNLHFSIRRGREYSDTSCVLTLRAIVASLRCSKSAILPILSNPRPIASRLRGFSSPY